VAKSFSVTGRRYLANMIMRKGLGTMMTMMMAKQRKKKEDKRKTTTTPRMIYAHHLDTIERFDVG
jgi:hypothetical protein